VVLEGHAGLGIKIGKNYGKTLDKSARRIASGGGQLLRRKRPEALYAPRPLPTEDTTTKAMRFRVCTLPAYIGGFPTLPVMPWARMIWALRAARLFTLFN